jgi:hypothetical protein
MPNGYTPFRLDFPGFALIDALSVIKDGAANTPAGRVQLAHSALDLTSWALHATLEKNGAGNYSGTGATYTATAPVDELSDDDAQRLLEQLCIVSTSDVDDDGTHMMAGCPISPATALKLAGWLLKAASIVLPIIL